MPKTITLRLDDKTYQMIKLAAQGERRSISNYIEYATVSHLTESSFVSDEEMQEILRDAELMLDLEQARADIANGNYEFVE